MTRSSKVEKTGNHDGGEHDELFVEAALYAAGQDSISDHQLADHFSIREDRARALMQAMAEHGLIAGVRRSYSDRSVLVQRREMAVQLRDLGFAVDDEDVIDADTDDEDRVVGRRVITSVG